MGVIVSHPMQIHVPVSEAMLAMVLQQVDQLSVRHEKLFFDVTR